MTDSSTNKSEPVKIAVFGSAKEPKELTWYGRIPKKRRLARNLGEMLGKVFEDKIEILTGACIGIPDIVAREARLYGTRVIGYSGAITLAEHLQNSNYANPSRFDKLKLLDPEERKLNGLAERSINMIRDADALVYLGGRTGTLGEYCTALDGTDKPMYVLRGTGGVISKIPLLNIKKHKGTGQVIKAIDIFDLVKGLDYNLEIADFMNDPEIQLVFKESGIIESAGRKVFVNGQIDPNKKTIYV